MTKRIKEAEQQVETQSRPYEIIAIEGDAWERQHMVFEVTADDCQYVLNLGSAYHKKGQDGAVELPSHDFLVNKQYQDSINASCLVNDFISDMLMWARVEKAQEMRLAAKKRRKCQ